MSMHSPQPDLGDRDTPPTHATTTLFQGRGSPLVPSDLTLCVPPRFPQASLPHPLAPVHTSLA